MSKPLGRSNEHSARWVRWTRAWLFLTWVTCIPALLPSPWHWANEAERSLERAHSLSRELGSKSGQTQPVLENADRSEARAVAWTKWILLAVVLGAGFIVTSWVNALSRRWLVGLVTLTILYVFIRWWFAPSSYPAMLRAFLNADALSAQVFLAKQSPLAFLAMVYYYLVVPVLLAIAAIVGYIQLRPFRVS
jgi:hypothetical protein